MEKTLKIDDNTAKDIYKTADSNLKLILEETFGKNFFKLDLKDKINTYEDVCEELDIDILTIRDFKFLPEYQREEAFLEHQIKSMIYLVNKGKSFKNYKYYCYRYKGGSGWVLGCYFHVGSGLGSGFYYTSQDDCNIWMNKFSDLYHKYLSFNK